MIMAILALNSASEYGWLLAMTAGIYVFFLLMGVGASSYASFSKCQKTDTRVHFVQGAIWSVFPTVAYLLIRTFEIIRVYFDRFYRGLDTSSEGAQRAGWISVGYVMMLAALAGMYSMMDSTINDVCVPTQDEAQAFKQKMLERQAQKEKAQEVTPAVIAQK